MKINLSILSLMLLLFTSCSSDDDSPDDQGSLADQKVRVEMTRITDNPEDYEDSTIMLSFVSYNDLEVETAMPLDSSVVSSEGYNIMAKEFFYSLTDLEETIIFETDAPVIQGIFYFETYKKEDAQENDNLYSIKVYNGDTLFTEEIISEETLDPIDGKIFKVFYITDEIEL